LHVVRKARHIRFTVNETNGFEVDDISFGATMDDASDGVLPVAVDGAITIWNPKAEDTGGGTFYRFSANDNAEGTARYQFSEDKYYVESIESPDAHGYMSGTGSQTIDSTGATTVVITSFNQEGTNSKRAVTDATNDDLTTGLAGHYHIHLDFEWHPTSAFTDNTMYGFQLRLYNLTSSTALKTRTITSAFVSGGHTDLAYATFDFFIDFIINDVQMEWRIIDADISIDLEVPETWLFRVGDAGSN